jgi:biopolymer transport protein ExbB/TolQ
MIGRRAVLVLLVLGLIVSLGALGWAVTKVKLLEERIVALEAPKPENPLLGAALAAVGDLRNEVDLLSSSLSTSQREIQSEMEALAGAASSDITGLGDRVAKLEQCARSLAFYVYDLYSVSPSSIVTLFSCP